MYSTWTKHHPDMVAHIVARASVPQEGEVRGAAAPGESEYMPTANPLV